MGVQRGLAFAAAFFAAVVSWAGGEEEVRHATGLLIPPHRSGAAQGAASPANAVRRTKSLLGITKDAEEPLPAKWDSRDCDYGCWVTPVRDQGNVGACWAFASYATLETQLLKTGRGEYDLSEKHLVNLHGLIQTDTKEGLADFAAAYLTRWEGAVAETNDPYIASLSDWTDSVPRMPAIHVQDIVWIPPRTNVTDNATLKKAIMDYGAVAVPMYCVNSASYLNCTNGAYYYPVETNADHLVAVVGWDDDYAAENFVMSPPGDGAWLIKNSWGTDIGDEGYLHVSYYDKAFHLASWIYGCVFIPAAEGEDYTAVYGYDRLGPIAFNLQGKGGPIAATFTASWNEELAAVGLYSCVAPLDYKIEVYTNLWEEANPDEDGKSTLAYSQTGTLTHLGYSTIPLDSPVPLTPGDRYSIVFSNTSECDRYFCVCAQTEFADDFKPVEGVTFYYYSEGNSWRDSTANKFYDVDGYGPYSGNICLKAYTRAKAGVKDSGPSEAADGTRMCAAVAFANPALYLQAGQTFGAFANIAGANNRTYWYSWLAGLDPALSDDFAVSLAFINGLPHISWSPDLSDRTYTIFGAKTLNDAEWTELSQDDVPTSSNNFFRVDVAFP